MSGRRCREEPDEETDEDEEDEGVQEEEEEDDAEEQTLAEETDEKIAITGEGVDDRSNAARAVNEFVEEITEMFAMEDELENAGQAAEVTSPEEMEVEKLTMSPEETAEMISKVRASVEYGEHEPAEEEEEIAVPAKVSY